MGGASGEAAGARETGPARACGSCSLCCTLLRVDELAKLAGTPCVHQRKAAERPRSEPQASGVRAPAKAGKAAERPRSGPELLWSSAQASGAQEGGCGIHPGRPAICRRYRCLWLRGSLEPGDRPDRLGAVLDLSSRGGSPELLVHEAEPGIALRSVRLREIVNRYRSAMPVRILDVESVLDPDRAFRVLLPDGEELRVAGDEVETWRDGARVGAWRLPWLERLARRIAIAARRIRLRPHRRGPRSSAASRREA
jgi:hypothetical protein